eukprot:9044808-Alexandrium_andersonii.AAC.1
MLVALASLCRALGAARAGPLGRYTELAGRALLAMAATQDVPVRLLYGRWIAELHVPVVFQVCDLAETYLAQDIQRLPAWGWQPS